MSDFNNIRKMFMKVMKEIEVLDKKIYDIEAEYGGYGYDLSLNDRSDFVMMLKAADKFNDVLIVGSKVGKETIVEGELYKNDQGRYEINPDYYFTSGSYIEILMPAEEDRPELWVSTRIEHNGDYYAVACPKQKLDGIRARLRK